VVLLQLDLCAAYNTVGHVTLAKGLESDYGVQGSIGLVSSLNTWEETECCDWQCSISSKKMRYGVRQGSVLGPILFAMYTKSMIMQIFEKLDMVYQIYAQMILSCISPGIHQHQWKILLQESNPA